jgi:2-polyprenyl-6-methoxyphenol hydroxylase-like FAD-dependent oxidoreductase
MAGQGLNLGIGDVGKIIELVEEAVETGEGE